MPTRPFTGNPAAVMPLERWLEDGVMQAIAAENNLAETAFTVASDGDEVDYELRWFTPTVEVNLCGHATLASAHVLMSGQRIRFATRSGILTVTREGDLLALDMPGLARRAGGATRVDACAGRDPARRSSAGKAMAMRSSCSMTRPLCAPSARTSPRWRNYRTWCRSQHRATSRTSPAGSSPLITGIHEDPVTGSAHTALVPFWAKRLGRESLTALQASPRTGVLHCRLEGERVILAGRCVTMIVGNFQL